MDTDSSKKKKGIHTERDQKSGINANGAQLRAPQPATEDKQDPNKYE